ncbi:MAG: hypothetical protein QM661_13080, partial [Solimonas sp.]
MSLRWWMGLLVAVAVVAVPTVNWMLLRLFPPPMIPAFHLRDCRPSEVLAGSTDDCRQVRDDGSSVLHLTPTGSLSGPPPLGGALPVPAGGAWSAAK